MNIIGKLKEPGDVPTPPAGYASFFVSTTGNVPNIKLSDGTILTLQGVQGEKGDTGTAATISGLSIEMLPPNSAPSVENTGTSSASTFVFRLPQSSILRRSVTVSFANGDCVQRITVADQSVTASMPPCAFTFTVLSSEAADLEIAYSIVLVDVTSGAFTVTITAFDPEGGDLLGHTLPEITLSYLTGA